MNHYFLWQEIYITDKGLLINIFSVVPPADSEAESMKGAYGIVTRTEINRAVKNIVEPASAPQMSHYTGLRSCRIVKGS